MSLTLALDAMGGDAGAPMVVHGASIALGHLQGLKVNFLFFGDKASIDKELALYPNLQPVSQVIHTDTIITSDTKPSSAVRRGRTSNMGMAIDAVAQGKACAVVSAGNTGAYMALSKLILKTLDGVDRPAIPAILPSIRSRCIVLDVGANVACTPEVLLQFALMGEAFASYLFKIDKPAVGLLNVGSEELKGNSVVQGAYQLLKQVHDMNFYGFVEGDDIAAGKTDVIVTDGFSGNIALKTIEGTAHLIRHFLKEALESSIFGKIGYLIARGAFKRLQKRTDPRLYNGALFLGLQGIAVKSHGGTDAIGFANAIQTAVHMAQQDFTHHVAERLKLIHTIQGTEK